MPTRSKRFTRWLVPAVLVVIWLLVGGGLGPYAGKLGEVATNDQAAFLPRSAESTQVVEAQKAFRQDETLPAVVVWTAKNGQGKLTDQQEEQATRALAGLGGTDTAAAPSTPAVLSADGEALQGVVQLKPDLGEELPAALQEIEDAASQVPGTLAQVAGPAATQADLTDAFAGIDGLLLVVALITVLLI
ncbi:MMPL family transporter, partial [Streptomyces xanthophaeus]